MLRAATHTITTRCKTKPWLLFRGARTSDMCIPYHGCFYRCFGSPGTNFSWLVFGFAEEHAPHVCYRRIHRVLSLGLQPDRVYAVRIEQRDISERQHFFVSHAQNHDFGGLMRAADAAHEVLALGAVFARVRNRNRSTSLRGIR